MQLACLAARRNSKPLASRARAIALRSRKRDVHRAGQRDHREQTSESRKSASLLLLSRTKRDSVEEERAQIDSLDEVMVHSLDQEMGIRKCHDSREETGFRESRNAVRGLRKEGWGLLIASRPKIAGWQTKAKAVRGAFLSDWRAGLWSLISVRPVPGCALTFIDTTAPHAID